METESSPSNATPAYTTPTQPTPTHPLPTHHMPTQIAVLKQGTYERGRWSTRVLTLDSEAGTVAISRKNNPQHILHRALNVQSVQMWPHYNRYAIEHHFNSLKAKMVLCITGKEVSLTDPNASVGNYVRNKVGILLSASIAAETNFWTAASLKQGSPKYSSGQKNSSTSSAKSAPKPISVDTSTTTWFISFTSIESYEMAVMILMHYKNEDGSRRKLFSNNVVADLARVKRASATEGERLNSEPTIEAI
ncbi:hypothetical protein Q4I30_006406 [Leishmania utingensis]|uniref:Uncharacterized protein n=1 Tax=Leishmania utingensis TaxID=653362 RepID=A0AAW3A4F6_9TRYP